MNNKNFNQQIQILIHPCLDNYLLLNVCYAGRKLKINMYTPKQQQQKLLQKKLTTTSSGVASHGLSTVCMLTPTSALFILNVFHYTAVNWTAVEAKCVLRLWVIHCWYGWLWGWHDFSCCCCLPVFVRSHILCALLKREKLENCLVACKKKWNKEEDKKKRRLTIHDVGVLRFVEPSVRPSNKPTIQLDRQTVAVCQFKNIHIHLYIQITYNNMDACPASCLPNRPTSRPPASHTACLFAWLTACFGGGGGNDVVLITFALPFV